MTKKRKIDGSIQPINTSTCLPSPARRSKRHRRRRPWSDVPHDLLGEVLQRLPSFADRARFRGVCRAWRAAEGAQPRPAMPWLIFPGHCVSLHDAAIYRAGPLSGEAAHTVTCRGSFRDWVALVPRSAERRPFLLNTFTSARIRLPRWKAVEDKSFIAKIVMSAAPDSEDCTVAAIVDRGKRKNGREIHVCRRPGRAGGCRWWPITTAFWLHDIVFFEGNLHAVDTGGRIHVFKDGDLEQLRQAPWTAAAAADHVARSELGCKLYLVALPARLLVVCTGFGTARVPGAHEHYVCRLKVFALDDGKMTPITNLDGHAIFVGGACAAAFAVTAGSSRIKTNQVCFVLEDTPYRSRTVVAGYRPHQLLSYDVSDGYLRMYRHPLGYRAPAQASTSTTAGTTAETWWRCILLKRFPHNGRMPSPWQETEYGHQLLLREVIDCLGAYTPPKYSTTPTSAAGWCRHGYGCHAVAAVKVSIPETASRRRRHRGHRWSFIQCDDTSVREAKQAAAYDAVTFLRRRFSDVLDDSPWSSIPARGGGHHDRTEDDDDEEAGDEDDYSNDWSFSSEDSSDYSSDDEMDNYGAWF